MTLADKLAEATQSSKQVKVDREREAREQRHLANHANGSKQALRDIDGLTDRLLAEATKGHNELHLASFSDVSTFEGYLSILRPWAQAEGVKISTTHGYFRGSDESPEQDSWGIYIIWGDSRRNATSRD